MLRQNKNNLVKSWKIIKEVINKKKKDHISDKFEINGKMVTDKMSIANSFNEFYVNVGSSLASKIPSTNINPTSYILNENKHSMFLTPVTHSEIFKIINDLKETSAGCDGIIAKVIKQNCELFIVPLCHILNLSLNNGYFPDPLKLAQVTPVFKSGNKQHIGNYRPVSVLPLFSKIFERVMYCRLLSFLTKHNILYDYQFGFREKHSTNLALIHLVNKILQSWENGNIVIGLFLDLSKAFDTVNHDILLGKLCKYGIRGVALNWFRSYLSNRKQFVKINNMKSDILNINCGIPQGSILGPLLFLIYVNDMQSISKKLYFLLFADDTNVFIDGKDADTIVNHLNEELKLLIQWLHVNKLSLNISKTHYIIFSPKRYVTVQNEIHINNNNVDQVKSTKFLGVVLDAQLSWCQHVCHLKNKISKGIGIICQARKVLNHSTLVTLYYCFISPYLNYCIEIWGRAADKYLDSLHKLQKRAVRIIVSAKFTAHTEPIFKNLSILPLKKIYQCSSILFMFKFIKGMQPEISKSLFKLNSEFCHYVTRQSSLLYLPKLRMSISQKFITYTGVKFWNYVCTKMENNCSFVCFKRRLRTYLLTFDICI
jgi:hypothetical protein